MALDLPDLAGARQVVAELAGLIRVFKVGLELFCAEGPPTVEVVREAGAEVFLDLKVHDIPRTAGAAVREAARLGASFLTVHALGGRAMLREAVETAREHGGPRLLAVTVLTSLADEDLAELGVEGPARSQALRLAQLAAEEGADGVVLSPRELEVVRVAQPGLLLATPGVRPAGAAPQDHRRTLTPAEAILAGADLIVVGRPVLQAGDRAAAAARIVEEVRLAEAQREGRRARDAEPWMGEAEDAEFVEEGQE